MAPQFTASARSFHDQLNTPTPAEHLRWTSIAIGDALEVPRKHGEKLRLDLGSRTDLLRESVGNGYVHSDMPVPP